MTVSKLNRANAQSPNNLPVKVLQFGEGNFLRAFVDWIIDVLNEKAGFNGGVQIVQPLPQGMGDILNQQEGLYHVILQGIKNGQQSTEARLIQCVKGVVNPFTDFDGFLKTAEGTDVKFMVSNTTESGIAFSDTDTASNTLAQTFPGKLTQWLHHRYQFFEGDTTKGLIHFPCELIEKNGENLKEKILQYITLWNLSDGFKNWILQHNTFCNTLVDRIVPGFPKEKITEIQKELGFEDQLVVTAEPFHLWVIEGPETVRNLFPTDKTSLQVVFTHDLTPYRSRKVRILNGAHTAMVPVAYLKGLRTVREVMEDRELENFVRDTIQNEIIPTLDLSASELKQFAHDVMERFLNPFIRHELISIALNSVSKFEVRVLPSITTYYARRGSLPQNLVTAFAALILFYRGSWRGENIPLNDSRDILDGFKEAWQKKSPEQVVEYVATLNNTFAKAFNDIPDLKQAVQKALKTLVHSERQAVL